MWKNHQKEKIINLKVHPGCRSHRTNHQWEWQNTGRMRFNFRTQSDHWVDRSIKFPLSAKLEIQTSSPLRAYTSWNQKQNPTRPPLTSRTSTLTTTRWVLKREKPPAIERGLEWWINRWLKWWPMCWTQYSWPPSMTTRELRRERWERSQDRN